MDYLNWVLIGLFAIFIGRRMMPAKGVNTISTAELKGRLKENGVQFVDVRTPGEYKGRHIIEFVNIPLDRLSSETGRLSKEKGVVVICQSGMRSTNAARQLKKLGFEHVTNIRGGMGAWH